jgi:uncharacterized protein DUF1569
MPHTIWNASDRDAIMRRFAQLSPQASPRWGKFDAPRMLAHVTDGVRMATGEIPIAPRNGPLKYWPINVLVMFYLPWPKSAPTAPELLERKPVDFQSELATLDAALHRFLARDINGQWTPHVAFGRLTGSQWGRLTYRHMDHHLGQFGI